MLLLAVGVSRAIQVRSGGIAGLSAQARTSELSAWELASRECQARPQANPTLALIADIRAMADAKAGSK